MKILLSKFTGRYRELSSQGYKLLSNSGSKHKVYNKRTTISDSVWIFVKGNDIEINDFYERSGTIIKYVIDHRNDKSVYACYFNTETNEIKPHDFMQEYIDLKEKNYSSCVKLWKVIFVDEGLFEEILRLYDSGCINFVEAIVE